MNDNDSDLRVNDNCVNSALDDHMISKMSDSPPAVITGVPENDKARYEKIKEKFVTVYGIEPEFYARAPGRVNLIGEHIDYCGYGVLPMAVEQDIIIATAVTADKKVILHNMDDNFKAFECSTEKFTINKEKPDWYNYFLCGMKGMNEFLNQSKSPGMKCMVDGTVPKSAGLSSSSALVCCAALTVMHASGQSKSKKEIADMCAYCERYIGTQGGGMDQAISFMAQPGTAKKIDFNPLREQDVTLPEGVTFVVSNCCVEKNKAASSDFNTRVVECRIAAQIIAKSKGLQWKEIKRLGQLQETLGVSLTDMDNLVQEVLHKQPYKKQEICDVLGVTAEELAETSLSPNTLTVEVFKLFDRARHVYGEARRVEEFQQICNTASPGATDKLGQLMNDSHTSCRDQYECSCPELDSLVDLCVQSGALGSRLTGAGWGGCAVSMVPTNQLSAFLDKVKTGYYQGDKASLVNEALFATKSGGGAAVYLP